MQSREDLFSNPDFDPALFQAALEKSTPAKTFGILFTPRSGSSWLTDILTKTDLLGKPQEWFNPNFIPNIARAINAADRDGYVDMLRRKQKRGGVFSFEVTIYQMRRTFGGEREFLSYFPADLPFFYLTREDIVLQAVSLAKAVETSVFHTSGSSSEDITRADQSFDYDANAISQWLDHIADQERRCAGFFRRHGITPQRLSYEEITEIGAEETAYRFLRTVRPEKVAETVFTGLDSKHRKLGSSRNQDYAERFRAERPDKISEIEEMRRGLVFAA